MDDIQCIYRGGCMSATVCIEHCRARELGCSTSLPADPPVTSKDESLSRIVEVLAAARHITEVAARGHSYYITENGRHPGSGGPWAELLNAVHALDSPSHAADEIERLTSDFQQVHHNCIHARDVADKALMLLRAVHVERMSLSWQEELASVIALARTVPPRAAVETPARTNQGDSACLAPGDPPDYDSGYTVAELAAKLRTKDRHIARLEAAELVRATGEAPTEPALLQIINEMEEHAKLKRPGSLIAEWAARLRGCTRPAGETTAPPDLQSQRLVDYLDAFNGLKSKTSKELVDLALEHVVDMPQLQYLIVQELCSRVHPGWENDVDGGYRKCAIGNCCMRVSKGEYCEAHMPSPVKATPESGT